ncbi:MAG: hypothetical protein RLZZ67_22 [Candidatus Parcubacteria bacterium]
MIILSPHFDDAVLSLGGFIASQNDPMVVATIFGGNPKEIFYTEWDRLSGFTDSNKALQNRVSENEGALALLGASINNYQYFDGQYRTLDESKEIQVNMVQDIEALIEKYRDKEISIYAPGGFEADRIHVDHRLVYNAFVDVLKRNDQSHVQFFVYEDFYDARQALAAEFPVFKDYKKEWGGVGFKKVVQHIDETDLDTKTRAIEWYSSQIKAFAAQGFDIESMVRKFNTERCKDDLSVPYACEVVYKVTEL